MERDEAYAGVKMDEVFGKYDIENHKRKSKGMVVAMGTPYDEPNEHYPNVCPVLGDKLPYKSVTVVCQPEQLTGVEHWLMFVHGGQPNGEVELDDGRIAIRSDYQCW